jgi:hypothetical protein
MSDAVTGRRYRSNCAGDFFISGIGCNRRSQARQTFRGCSGTAFAVAPTGALAFCGVSVENFHSSAGTSTLVLGKAGLPSAFSNPFT